MRFSNKVEVPKNNDHRISSGKSLTDESSFFSGTGSAFFFFLPFPVFGTSAHTTPLKHSQEPYCTDDQKLSTKKHLLSSAKAEDSSYKAAHDEGTEKKTLRVQKNVYRGIRLGHGENGQLRLETVTRASAFGLAFST
ncbi:hypothetical protein WN944_010273 [Citrus x changshan-huyou]|uniref:Uncharacterized protein n=1 Tax=Citrus x changshan-huyou TaxID=2935761 RepID=A0AAP0MTD0_9ROSI